MNLLHNFALQGEKDQIEQNLKFKGGVKIKRITTLFEVIALFEYILKKNYQCTSVEHNNILLSELHRFRS
jgi:hypothetical protein